jgi:predicted nucleic acid-binding protein
LFVSTAPGDQADIRLLRGNPIRMKAGRSPIPANDAWIAALARQPRMPIVTRDIHFDRVKNIGRLAW